MILSYEDYITTDLDEEGERRVHLNIGPDGHIIPDSEWQEANPNYCEEENRFMKNAVKRLQFKMFSFSDGYDVFIQYIDIGTCKIEHQHEGQGEDLSEAIGEAWDQLEVDIKAPTDPCGRPKGFTLYFNSQITDTDESLTIFEHVEAEFQIQANAEGTYDGSGALTYLTITSSIDGNCTFPDGKLNAREFIYAMEDGSPTEEMGLDIEYSNVAAGGTCSSHDEDSDVYVPHWPFNFTGMHMDEWVSEDGKTWKGLILKGGRPHRGEGHCPKNI